VEGGVEGGCSAAYHSVNFEIVEILRGVQNFVKKLGNSNFQATKLLSLVWIEISRSKPRVCRGQDTADVESRDSLQQTATDCNRLQQTETHCNSLQHIATHCDTVLQHITT